MNDSQESPIKGLMEEQNMREEEISSGRQF
jgi:hypothetical protein